ncbi:MULTISPECIES: hypothetical protein [unclassified Streptomyces]|jgi:hypothetical protein|nr:hypothetical protein [Streptomyces sp. HUAS 15-9]UXY28530.1 hypothetical protein N8I87_19495 [Streptomyces sp. HUAS 15-9]
MPSDPYAVLRALLRAEAVRSTPKPEAKKTQAQQPRKDGDR